MVQLQITCVIRGCEGPGEFFMRRVKRDGTFQAGLMCDADDRRYGEENLQRLAEADKLYGTDEGDC